MSFENQNGLGVDGIAGPAVWTAPVNDTINAKTNGVPYVYVLVNKVVPQTLTLWNNGAAQFGGIRVNTGAPGADTTDGTYAVFEHVRYSEMKGTNPDGSAPTTTPTCPMPATSTAATPCTASSAPPTARPRATGAWR